MSKTISTDSKLQKQIYGCLPTCSGGEAATCTPNNPSSVCKRATDQLLELIISSNNQLIDKLLGELPEKRKLIEPVTKREVGDNDRVGIDLDADTKGSLVFIQDNGFNSA